MGRASPSPMLLVLVAALLVMSGCSDQSAQAKVPLAEARASVARADALLAETTKMLGQTRLIDPNSERAVDAQPFLQVALNRLTEIRQADKAAMDALDRASALDVPAETRTYIEQQREIAALQLEAVDMAGDLVFRLSGLYQPAPGAELAPAEVTVALKDADEVSGRLAGLNASIATKTKASEQFYEANKLGE